MKKAILLFTVLLIAVTGVQAQDFSKISGGATGVLWRDALMLPQNNVMIGTRFQYLNFEEAWNQSEEEWESIDDDVTADHMGVDAFLAYGITKRWELGVRVPFRMANWKQGDSFDNSVSGIGDMMVGMRYLLLPWYQVRAGWAVLGGVRIPTGDRGDQLMVSELSDPFYRHQLASMPADGLSPVLGDGSFDFNLGTIVSYQAQFGFYTHVKVNYWFNGTTEGALISGYSPFIFDADNADDIKVGNEFEGEFVLGFWLTDEQNLKPQLSWGYLQSESHEIDDEPIERSSYERFWGGFDFEWDVNDRFTVRPGIRVYYMGARGTRPNYVPMFDAWYHFSL